MIKIRKNVFETNSSSTHTLILTKKSTPTQQEREFLQNLKGTISPWRDTRNIIERPTILIEGPVSLLQYFYGLAIQNGHIEVPKNPSTNNDYEEADKLVSVLKEICPNVVFEKWTKRFGYYELIDADWLFSEDPFTKENPFIDLLLNNKENLMDFLLHGKIYYSDRDCIYDYPKLEAKIEKEKKEAELAIEVSG